MRLTGASAADASGGARSARWNDSENDRRFGVSEADWRDALAKSTGSCDQGSSAFA
jgi:hypothetical protein